MGDLEHERLLSDAVQRRVIFIVNELLYGTIEGGRGPGYGDTLIESESLHGWISVRLTKIR